MGNSLWANIHEQISIGKCLWVNIYGQLSYGQKSMGKNTMGKSPCANILGQNFMCKNLMGNTPWVKNPWANVLWVKIPWAKMIRPILPRVSEKTKIFEDRPSHLTSCDPLYQKGFGQIWAYLVQKWSSASQKTIYVVILLHTRKLRNLQPLISQRSCITAPSAIRRLKAVVLRFPKWCDMTILVHWYHVYHIGY